MRKERNRILSILIIISIFINTLITSNAATNVSVSVINNPKIDVALTMKDTTLDLSNFEADVRQALQNKGIDTSNIQFKTIERGLTSTNTSDASIVFNKWKKFGDAGQWSLTTYGGNKVIYNAENTFGTTGYYSPDTMNLTDMTIEYDFMPADTDDDFVGIVLRFNMEEDLSSTSKPLNTKITGYWYWENNKDTQCAAWKNATGLYKVNNAVLPADSCTGANGYYSYNGTTINKGGLGTYYYNYGGSGKGYMYAEAVNHAYAWKNQSGVTQLVAPANNQSWTKYNAWTHYKFQIQENTITIWRNGTQVLTYTDTSDTPIKAGSFALINMSQASRYKDFICTYSYYKTYEDVLKESSWREDAKHIVVNVDDKIDETLTGESNIGEILSRTLEDQIHFIQWGTDTNKTSTTNFIARNDNRGLFINNSNYASAVDATANYIKGLIEQEQETQTVIVGQPTSLIVSPSQYKTNATSTDFPNGRWKIVHTDTYFANSMGKENDLVTPNLNFTFNKSGKYTIYFDNQPVKEVYAHRKPIADFDISITNGNITLESTSYDLDTTINKGYGPGIASENWYYKKASDTSWTPGKIVAFTGDIYMIRLDVTDNQDETASAIKYIGTGKPVAKFSYLNNPVGKYKTLQIKDTSYDPTGLSLTSYKWVLKKDGVDIGTYTTKSPNLTFKNLGIGNYSYTLIVTNSNNISSDPYTNLFTVIDDIDKPEISVTPTSCTWKGSQIANVTVTDSESGFGKFRYIATLSETFPSSDAAWSNWITTNPSTATVTGSTTGEYYLHIEAYDAAGNLATKTIGKYQIDKTVPNVSKITMTKNNVNKTNITVTATDEHSGMYQYAISTTATQPNTFQSSNVLTATQLGTHYIWTKDMAGNVGYTTYNVTELDFAITTSCGTQGIISAYSIVPSYKATSISIIPATGFKIKDVVVDGVSKGAVSTYDFWDVTSNHSVVATFERDTKITTILNSLKTKYDWITFK